MKKKEIVPSIILGALIISIVFTLGFDSNINVVSQQQVLSEKIENTELVQIEEPEQEEIIEQIVYDGMTMDELAQKLNKSLNSTVSGKGDLFAKYSIQYGVDPYLAVAIMLHETGCKWTCSSLAQKCNNYGGQKGNPSCNGGSYKKYATQEEGIEGYIKNLANNYIKKGLTTPEQINKRYAEDKNWHVKINNYIKSIKSK